MRNLWRHPYYLVWAALAYIPWLGSMSVPLTGDQKVYLSTAMEMRHYGSWLRPLLFGQSSYYKPPFEYWMTLLGWKLMGFNLWGALLPSVLAVLLTAWLLGEIALLIHQRTVLVTAGLWFASALGTAIYGTTAQMEIYLCLFYAASWWAGLKFLSPARDQRNWKWLYLAFGLAGLSALVKSPLYSVLWGSGYLLYLVIEGEWEIFRSKHLYLSIALGAVLGSAWFFAVLITDYDRFWNRYVMQETWEKKQGNGGSMGELWGALLYFCLPFTLLVLASIRGAWRAKHSSGIASFVLCWSLPPALFFSFYPYRIKPYLYILVPALCVLVDWGLYRASRTRVFRVFMALSGGILLVLFLVLGLVLWRAGIAPGWIAAGFALAGVSALVMGLRDLPRGLAVAGLAGVLLFRVAAVEIGEQDMQGLREAVAAHPEQPLAMLDEDSNIWHDIGLISVGLGKEINRLATVSQVSAFISSGGLVVLSDDQARELLPRLKSAKDSPSLEEVPWMRWKKRSGFPFRQVILNGSASMPGLRESMQREFKIIYKGKN